MNKSKNELDNFENFEQPKLYKQKVSKQPIIAVA